MADREYLDTLRHESAHALAAVALGLRVVYVEAPPPSEHCRGAGGRVRTEHDDLPPVHDEIVVLVAGPLGGDVSTSVRRLIRHGNDMARARYLAGGYFYAGAPIGLSDQLDDLVAAHVRSYLRRLSSRVRGWLALPPQQAALTAIEKALTGAASLEGRLDGGEVHRICEENGIEHRPGILLPPLPDRRRIDCLTTLMRR